MEKETTGTVTAVSRQWWLKINTKPVRVLGTDGAVYPHIITVSYCVGDAVYRKRKWIPAGWDVPHVGDALTVVYDVSRPKRAQVM